MCVDMCMDMCMEISIAERIDMWTWAWTCILEVPLGTGMGVYIDMCIAMYTDMC